VSLITPTAREERLLASLSLSVKSFYRFRKASVVGNQIVVLCQAGGPNRVCYCEYLGELDEDGNAVKRPVEIGKKFHELDCSVVIEKKLREHPNYISDQDTADPHFATFAFRKP